MVTKAQIEELINPRLNSILLIAQASLPESQFKAFRKLILDQFGGKGLGEDLERLFNETKGKARFGQEYIVQQKGCLMSEQHPKFR